MGPGGHRDKRDDIAMSMKTGVFERGPAVMPRVFIGTVLAMALFFFYFRVGAAGLQAVILAALACILAQEGI
ncbi:MAG: hypothetical protein A2Y70_06575 [Candidatus Aminicenantes bacterium RBG_13_64_14]|nr:MAG: hypothetical protein A2Y70_06575 [Candidatus Aminicenantes bacterium RBG_13_64_14]